MRELRFRVWDKDRCRFEYFEIGENDDCYGIFRVTANKFGSAIEQYTGLKDRNGKKVYENDIVSEHNGDIKGKVVQNITGEWQIAWIGIFGGYSCLYDHTSLCEIIGNAHENSGLLSYKVEE